MSRIDEVVWDGRKNAYIPGEELKVDPSLRLHRGAETELDPVLFEVLRHNLWNVNDEHGTTILKVSGSPIASTAEDFQTTILTEDAEFVFFGPRIQTQSGTMDLGIKWTMENRSADPGIEDGDMFLCNDPWVGATHQMDVSLFCPVFWEGELFCWVGNAIHQYDLGGSTPGGFCPDAEETFTEPNALPPFKIVERGKLRPDLEEMYLRHSRMPDMVALDLRAQIAGNNAARDRILALIRRYGPDVVKATMRKIIDDAERTFVDRIERLPDGVWRSRSYVEVAVQGDRGVYPVALQVRKEGAELTFTMEGTHEQVGALNVGFATWRSGILTAVSPMLCHDLLYATGGPLRRMRFEPTPGTLLCASWPGSVSNTQIGVCITGGLATHALGSMLAADPELAREVFAPGAGTTYPIDAISGVTDEGEKFGTFMLDPQMGATGAFTHRDGIDTGGCFWDPRSIAPNVEENEFYFPLLYLYRKEWEDSGGAGRWRGGNSAVFGFVPHGAEEITHATATAGVVAPSSEGLLGGQPASPCRYRFLRDTDVEEQFAAGRVPADFDQVKGTPVAVGPKVPSMRQGRGDVMEVAWCAGGGIGDPLAREPERVLEDVRSGAVSAEWARRDYGVVIENGELDAAATESLRAEIRARRLGEGAKGEAMPAGGPETAIGPALILAENGGRLEVGCGSCRTRLASDGASYKEACRVVEEPVAEVVPSAGEATGFVDATVVLRRFSCPACGTQVGAEVAREGDPLLHDFEPHGAPVSSS